MTSFFQFHFTLYSQISGDQEFRVPMPEEDCPVCGNGDACGGLVYPFIDPSKYFAGKEIRNFKVKFNKCSWDAYFRHKETLKPALAPGFPLPPRTSLGLYVGKIGRKTLDIEIPLLGTVLARRSIAEILHKRFAVQYFDITVKGKPDADYVQLYAPPVAFSNTAPYCNECDRGHSNMTGTFDKASLPKGVHFFKIKNAPNFEVFTEEFYEAINKFSIMGEICPVDTE